MNKKGLPGVSIGREGVSAVKALRSGGGWVLSGYGSAPANLNDPKNLAEGIASALMSSGVKGAGIALSIPDTFARAAIFEFEELPAKRREAEEIIRLRAGKELNSGASDRLSYFVLSNEKRLKALAVTVRESVIAPIEEALFAAGFTPERISIHSLNICNLFSPKAPEGDFSLLVRAEDCISITVFRGGVLDFYRCKAVNGDEEAVREISSSFLFYRGRNPEIKVERNFLFGGSPGLIGLLKGSMEVNAVSPDGLVGLQGHATDKSPVSLLSALGAAAGAL